LEKVVQRRIAVKTSSSKTVLLVVWEVDEKTGATVEIRTSELTTSAALELGFQLQKACEDILRQHGEDVERIHGRQCRDVKTTGV